MVKGRRRNARERANQNGKEEKQADWHATRDPEKSREESKWRRNNTFDIMHSQVVCSEEGLNYIFPKNIIWKLK